MCGGHIWAPWASAADGRWGDGDPEWQEMGCQTPRPGPGGLRHTSLSSSSWLPIQASCAHSGGSGGGSRGRWSLTAHGKPSTGSAQPTRTPATYRGWDMGGGVSGRGHLSVEARGCAHRVGNYDHRGDRCLQGGHNPTASPGRVGGHAVGVAGAHRVGPGRIWGCGVIRGCAGSVGVSLCVGGGEDVGGWELIS